MIYCKQCNELMDEKTNFCTNCGEGQKINDVRQTNNTVLIVLCTLTIIGSIFTIVRALFYEMASMLASDSNYYRGWIYAISGIGTLVGAFMMMQRKLDGLYVYSVSQIIYLITVIIASLSYGSNNAISIIVAMFFFIPSAIFLLLFWTKNIKKCLQ